MKYLLILFIVNSYGNGRQMMLEPVPHHFNTISECTRAGQEIIASPSKPASADITFQCIKAPE